MVHISKCEACGKERTTSPNLSFHRFPNNDEKRRIWASLMGWSSSYPNKKVIFICSDHFDPNDIQSRVNGNRYLKQDAYPLPQHSVFENSSISDNSLALEAKCSEQDKILWASSYNSDNSKPDEENSSSTLTASEFEGELSKLEFVEPNMNKMPKVSKQEQNLQQESKIPLQDAIDGEFIKIDNIDLEDRPQSPKIEVEYLDLEDLQQSPKIEVEYLDLADLPQSPKIEAEDLSRGELMNDQSELGFSTTPSLLYPKNSCKRSISYEDECSIKQYSSKKQKLNEAQKQPKKSSCELFLLSLVPLLESMSDHQQLSFQRRVLELLEDIKYPHSKIASS